MDAGWIQLCGDYALKPRKKSEGKSKLDGEAFA